MTQTIPTVASAPRVRRGLVLALLSSAMFLIILNSAMVNLATSSIRHDLALSPMETTAVANVYMVAVAGLVLLGGRLADVLGARRMFLLGIGLYVLASALAALAGIAPVLLAARLGQGIGAATTIPAALALLLRMYHSAADRTRAVGVWGAVSGAGSLIGVFGGGLLTDALGWTSVFWVPVPLGILIALAVWWSVPASPRTTQRIDIPGAISVTVGVAALTLGMVTAADSGWASPATLLILAAGISAIVVFVLVERRSPHPLVPITIVRRAPVVIAAGVMLLAGGTLTSLFFFLPLFQQDILGMTALASGLSQVPIAVVIIIGSILAPALSAAVGVQRALRVALLALLAGVLWIALNPAMTFGWQHVGAFILVGVGLGLGLVNATAMAVRDGAAGEQGLLSGLVNSAQTLGGAVGLAALTGIGLSAANASGGIDFTAVFFGGAGLVSLAVVLTFLRAASHRGDRRPSH